MQKLILILAGILFVAMAQAQNKSDNSIDIKYYFRSLNCNTLVESFDRCELGPVTVEKTNLILEKVRGAKARSQYSGLFLLGKNIANDDVTVQLQFTEVIDSETPSNSSFKISIDMWGAVNASSLHEELTLGSRKAWTKALVVYGIPHRVGHKYVFPQFVVLPAQP